MQNDPVGDRVLHAPAGPLTAEDRYLFDLRGYALIEDLLDADTLARCHAVIDEHYRAPAQLTQQNCYRGDFVTWDPLMLKIAMHPRILGWLDELCGPYPRFDHMYFYHMRRGEPEALEMHGGGDFIDHAQYYQYKNGRMYCGLIVVAVTLVDAPLNMGGFCCVPGSHKSNYQSPFPTKRWSDPVVSVPMRAGSAIVFTEALMHGTMAWRNPHDRRGLFYKYSPSSVSYSQATLGRWDKLRPMVDETFTAQDVSRLDELTADPKSLLEISYKLGNVQAIVRGPTGA